MYLCFVYLLFAALKKDIQFGGHFAAQRLAKVALGAFRIYQMSLCKRERDGIRVCAKNSLKIGN